MQAEDLQAWALLDALTSNWSGIAVRIGPLPPALAADIEGLRAALAADDAASRVAVLVDELLDLVLDTPADAYVRELVQRHVLAPTGGQRDASAQIAVVPATAGELGSFQRQLQFDFGTALQAATDIVDMPVYYATNREPDATAAGGWGAGLGSALGWGRVSVSIPLERHRLGVLETRPFWALWRDRGDRERYMVMGENLCFTDPGQFGQSLHRQLQSAGGSDLLVFLHGYNVSFEEAARRAAQLACDLSFDGAVVLFSWASWGSLPRYVADEDRARVSATALAEFLRTLQEGPWRRVHLLAHSMGNRVLLGALAGRAQPLPAAGRVVLAAADVYTREFTDIFPRVLAALGPTPGQLTSYVSRSDRALLLSRWLHGAERIGLFDDGAEPTILAGLETIDATNVDTSMLTRHSYFGDERSVITDLGLLLAEGLPPARRGLREVPGRGYWRFAR